MPQNEDRVRLGHMLEAAKEAVAFAEGKRREDLEADRLLSLALSKLIENIGEAADNVSADTQGRHADIPWPDIIGMRHRLIHRYFGIDLDIVWQVVTRDLPLLIATLEKIVSSEEN